MSRTSLQLGAAGVVAALVVGGAAWASQESQSTVEEQRRPIGQETPGRDDRARGHRRHRGLIARMARADVVLVVHGEVRRVRLDRGVVKSVARDAITLEERDGTVVTIRADADTRVRVNRERASLADVEEGYVAMTIREGDGPARAIRAFDREGMRTRTRK